MKKCPECQREYNDERLNFCLDDGTELLFGPARGEPATAVLGVTPSEGKGAFGVPPSGGLSTHDAPTRTYPAATEPPEGGTPSALHMTRMAPVFKKRFFLAIFAIAAIVLGSFLSYRYFSSAKGTQINSIAVMPFVNESGSPDAEYLSDGMTEILIGSLSQLPNMNVKARSSVFRYKGKEIDPRAIATELGVQAMVTGRVVQRANNLTLYVELVDTATENVLWKADYNRSLTDLIALQNEIAHDVSQKLRSKLSPSDEIKLAQTKTQNPEAYRLYLQGRYFWNKRRIEAMGHAIAYFQQAIDLDPAFALAHAGLADAVAQPSDVIPHRDRAEKARAAARRALELDPNLAESHTAFAHILTRYDLDFAGAERELKRALELDPKWADTYQRYAELCSILGRHVEALEWSRKGLELEPVNMPLNTNYAARLLHARRYDEAITQLHKTLQLEPDYRTTHVILAAVYAFKGMHRESISHRAKALELGGLPEFAARIRNGYETGGWRRQLEIELHRLQTAPERTIERTSHLHEAHVLAAMGEKEKALDALDRSVAAAENPALVFLNVDPGFDPLRGEPRFKAVIEKLGLPVNR